MICHEYASTGFLGFELKMDCSPWLLPPILESLPAEITGTKEAVETADIINHIMIDIQNAEDALAVAKVVNRLETTD